MNANLAFIFLLFWGMLSGQTEKDSIIFANYQEASEMWESVEDIHHWISTHFKYDFSRAKSLSNTQKANTKLSL